MFNQLPLPDTNLKATHILNLRVKVVDCDVGPQMRDHDGTIVSRLQPDQVVQVCLMPRIPHFEIAIRHLGRSDAAKATLSSQLHNGTSPHWTILLFLRVFIQQCKSLNFLSRLYGVTGLSRWNWLECLFYWRAVN